eukprot:CAMPEP_0175838514 /NCGR_PEP_ID=MMETSP0107_2-20121207/18294_1 /TAXON_ID=195067 ORGANISM="Goniomonas pacifica, Strain CCMP1869" /NCGR_SAMPLE_ID=MMETSP0107_2 /ASSEMBLY_ACC=CAM_ASM_000203 /LENGTH=295 /DNA_ID=CAMNT_0017152135 /DNA_START=331 /DNA_END=1216 /DNA_ORIENTATION=-
MARGNLGSSAKAGGAVFSFTVPLVLAKPDPEDPPPPPSPPPQITKPFLLIASASALVAESLGEAAVRSGAARGFTAISLPTDRHTVATALAAAPPPPGDAMVICNVAIVDLAGPPTIHGGSLDVDAQLSPHWWTYGRPYSDMFLSLHVPVVAIVPLSQSTALPPGVRAGFSFPASYTKLRHAVTQALGQYYPNSESESSRLSPSSSQWASPPPQSLPPIRGNLRAHRQPRVLYADDNGINRRIMEMMLHQVGCPVTLVGGGAEGVARATTEPFDLIITDIQMPEVDGFELTRRIR